jgi:hypothetical protein
VTADAEQPDLFAACGDSAKRPHGASQLVPKFLDALTGRGWVSGAVLARELGVDLRTLRAAAHESGGLIVGHDRGYARTEQIPLVDVHRVTRRLLSQSNRMRDRVRQIEAVRHGACGDLGSAA